MAKINLSTAGTVKFPKIFVMCVLIGIFTLPTHQVIAQDCSCGAPCYVLLDYDNIFGIEDFVACLTIEGGPDLVVEPSADVTLTAGESIALIGGFSVSGNATFSMEIDPLLFCDVTIDLDSDESDACLDCDDDNSSIHPGAIEVCDDLDNDCDGAVDEGNPGGGSACSTGQVGVCAAGTTSCTGGQLQCDQNVQPTVEVCDDLDNDCDGAVDEGNPGGGSACSTGQVGVCAAGTTSCTGGQLQCDQNVQPAVEVCDDLDNDCDGAVDEGLVCPSCTDGIQNGDETDTDCGGTTCPACALGNACIVNSDCVSNACEDNLCVP